MEWILIINGVPVYWVLLAGYCATGDYIRDALGVTAIVGAVEFVLTIILSLVSKDKARLAKVTMINKFVQIPYYILFFIIAVCGVLVMMGLMGIGLLFIPVFIAIDIGVFLTTLIPQEICTIRLMRMKKISVPKFVGFLIGNCVYVVDVVLSVLVHREYKKIGKE